MARYCETQILSNIGSIFSAIINLAIKINEIAKILMQFYIRHTPLV